MTIAEEFSDEGHSSKNIKGRSEFVRMMEKIESGEDGVEYVLVFKLSRFGRNDADVLNSLQIMQDYGVNLICVEDGIDSSKDAGKLMIYNLNSLYMTGITRQLFQRQIGSLHRKSAGRMGLSVKRYTISSMRIFSPGC